MSYTHGMSDTRMYRLWEAMRTRCNNRNSKSYKNYGGRGISICEEWNDFETFYSWAMSHGYMDDLTIDRIDCNRGYEPSNCRWIPRVDQALNRRNTIRLTYKGREYTPTELSNLTGISINTIYDAHRNVGIHDFSSYEPRKAAVKNITERANGYEVTVKGKYFGRFKTMDDAIRKRDEVIDWINEHGDLGIRY